MKSRTKPRRPKLLTNFNQILRCFKHRELIFFISKEIKKQKKKEIQIL